jgi:hypothetical protein
MMRPNVLEAGATKDAVMAAAIPLRQPANADSCGPSGDAADRRRIARIIETEFGN